jgi:hypothetical protein
MQRAWDGEKIVLPEVKKDRIVFTANKNLTPAYIKDVEYVVYVDAQMYDNLKSDEKKHQLARLIGKINQKLKNSRFILIGPGRWGSSNLSLGVGVTYSDINNTQVLIETAFENDGIVPELSFGTHFFQDLVEADIVPLALYPDDEKVLFNKDELIKGENLFADFISENNDFEKVIKVLNFKKEHNGFPLNICLDADNAQGIAYF